MNRFIKKYYIYLIVVLSFGFLIIFTIFESHKVYILIKNQSVILKQTQMDHVLAEEYLQNIYVFKKDAAYIHENNENFNILLPDRDDEKVRLFSTLETISQETGNKSIVLAVKKDREKSDKKNVIKPQTENYLNITVSLVGNYNDLVSFLRRMENMHYMADVLSVHSIKTKDEKPTLSDSNEEEMDEEYVSRDDLLKSDINIVFYLDDINK